MSRVNEALERAAKLCASWRERTEEEGHGIDWQHGASHAASMLEIGIRAMKTPHPDEGQGGAMSEPLHHKNSVFGTLITMSGLRLDGWYVEEGVAVKACAEIERLKKVNADLSHSITLWINKCRSLQGLEEKP